MKKKIFIILVAVVGLIDAYGVYATWRLEHVKHITATSPSKKMAAAVVLLGEGGDPPYGESIVIYETSDLFGWLTGEEVYRGYCEGKTTLSWIADTKLELRCGEYKKAKIQKGEAKGIRISYIVDPNAILHPNNGTANTPVHSDAPAVPARR